jgi:N-methylhydantoinase B/oxoprolinase/acetone carboxylase alpha subunit
MAAPNIVNVATITAKSAAALLTTSLASQVSNAASSGKVLKINNIVIGNITASAATVRLAYNTAAAGLGTSYYLAYDISVPAGASLIITDKTTAFYLEENTSVVALSGTSSALHCVVSFEELS